MRELVWYAVAALVAGLMGCKDSALVASFIDVTSSLSAKVNQNNHELAKLADNLEGCETELARARNDAPVVRTRVPMVALPRLIGDRDIEGFTQYEAQLRQALDRQRQRGDDLHVDIRECTEELESVKRGAVTER